MKNIIINILIIVGILVGVVLLDTLQARIFNNSPIISWKEELEDDDSYVDRGILIDTYYCIKEKDIVTVSFHIKGNKFACPIDNILGVNERKQNLINLLKEKMIEAEILDEDNLETFSVIQIYEYGYYRDTPEKKHMQFEFQYSCKDGTKKCLPELFKRFGITKENSSLIWGYTDEKEFFELPISFAIHINDDYEFTGNVIK